MNDLPAIQPPLFVWQPNDLAIFARLEDISKDLEAVDVRNGVYTSAYDSAGRRLYLEVKRQDVRWWARPFAQDLVIAKAVDQEPPHPDELRNILLRALENHGSEQALDALALSDLVKAAVTKFGYS